ncbi:GINS complex subunit [Microsporum canis]
MEGIDDILASLDRDDFSSPEATAVDHQQLTRFWVAERAVPELLPWPGPLMDRMMERISKQAKDLSMSACDTTGATTHNPTLNLKLSILQSDLARTQYLMRSILRQRLSKLVRYSIYYLRISMNQEQEPTERDAASILSDKELQFLRSHQSLLTMHYNVSFLSSFPANLKRLDDNVGGTNMVVAPENKEVVFVRCLSEEARIVIPAAEGAEDGMAGLERYGSKMGRGEVWVVRWEGVKDAWKRGEIEVL